MSAESEILAMPTREAIGSTVRFKDASSGRVKLGQVTSISGSGVRVVTPKSSTFLLVWSDLLEVVDMRGVKS